MCRNVVGVGGVEIAWKRFGFGKRKGVCVEGGCGSGILTSGEGSWDGDESAMQKRKVARGLKELDEDGEKRVSRTRILW